MFKRNQPGKSLLIGCESFPDERLERKIARMRANREGITDVTVNLMYTERKDGVRAETDIRTNKWGAAAIGGDVMAESALSARKMKAVPGGPANTEGESTPTT